MKIPIKRYRFTDRDIIVTSLFFVAIIIGISMRLTSYSSAATALMVPNGDVTAGFQLQSSTTADCPVGGSINHCSSVNDGATDNDADYVKTGTLGSTGEVEEFLMNSPSSVDGATQVTVKVRANSITLGSAVDSIGVALRVNGTLLPVTTFTLSTVIVDYTATFNGTWSQSDVDSMQVYIVRTANGTGNASSKDDDVAIYNVSATLTYSLVIPLEQSVFRWFDNLDSSLGYYLRAVGTGSDEIYISASAITSDGGYVSVANGNSSSDIIIMKYDNIGKLTWSRTWGAAAGEYAADVVETSDGGYVVAGRTGTVGANTALGAGGGDMLFLKYSSTGTLVWTRLWGGTASETIGGVVEMGDGSIVAVGSTASYGGGGDDVALLKMTSAGVPSWARTWNASTTTGPSDTGYDIKRTSDGGFIVTGYTGVNGDNDDLLIKFDASGTASWAKTWGFSGYSEYGKAVAQTSDGGYVIAGETYQSASSVQDINVIKYTSAGALDWNRAWGVTGSFLSDYSRDVIQTSDGGYAVAGETQVSTNDTQALLLKLSSSGTISWHNTIGKTSYSDSGRAVVQTSNGGYFMSGITNSLTGSSNKSFHAVFDSSGAIPGCPSAMCTTVTAGSSVPKNVPETSPSGSQASPTGTTSTPTSTTSSPSYVITSLVEQPIGVGAPLGVTNAAASVSTTGTPVRLRLALHATNSQYDVGANQFKLQAAQRGADNTCDTTFSGETYTDISTSSGGIRFYDNPAAWDGISLSTDANDPSHSNHTIVRQTYNESNVIAVNTAIPVGQDGVWDFALVLDGSVTPGSTYCLRMIKNSGNLLTTYTAMPSITLLGGTVGPTLDQQLRGGQSVVNGVDSPLNW